MLCRDFSKNKDNLLDHKRASLFSSYLVRTIPLPSQGVGVETEVYVIKTLGKNRDICGNHLSFVEQDTHSIFGSVRLSVETNILQHDLLGSLYIFKFF